MCYSPLKPVPFDPLTDALLLRAAGYVHTYYPATWEDVGGPENGPELAGHPSYHEYRRQSEPEADHVIIVVDQEVVDSFNDCPDMPF